MLESRENPALPPDRHRSSPGPAAGTRSAPTDPPRANKTHNLQEKKEKKKSKTKARERARGIRMKMLK